MQSVHGVILALAEIGTNLSSQEKISPWGCSFSHCFCTLVPRAFIAEMTHQMPLLQSRSMGMEIVLYPAGALLSTSFRMGHGQWGPLKLKAHFPVLSNEGAELELATVAQHAALCKLSWLQQAYASSTSM